MIMLEFLGYHFIQNAFAAGTAVAIICAVLGLFIVLRKLSFITDGIAHASLAGIAAAIVLGADVMAVAGLVALLSGLGINRMRERMKISGDAAIGLLLPVGLAAGIILLSLAHVTSVDVMSYLFGSILAITQQDVFFIAAFGAAVLAVVAILRKQLFCIAFDEDSARASGLPVSAINYVFFGLVGITVVLALRVAGIMLVSALMIIPPLAALQLKRNFSATLALSAAFGVLSVWAGIIASYYIGVATGAAIALASFALFLLAYAAGRLFGELG
jgi:zinc transport system permease protein